VSLFLGEKNSLLVEPTKPDLVYNLTALKLIDLKGIEFQEIPLRLVPEKPGLYQGAMFVPPNDFFHLGVSIHLQSEIRTVEQLLDPS
jgi:hypothetical protein